MARAVQARRHANGRIAGKPRVAICEQVPQVDVRHLKKQGFLPDGMATRSHALLGLFPDDVRIEVRPDTNRILIAVQRKGQEFETPVDLTWAYPNFGVRTYLICPKCYRRCEVLYLLTDLGCRFCQPVKFMSQKWPARAWTQFNKAKRIRQKAGANYHDDVWQPLPDKPRNGSSYRMHNRLNDRYRKVQGKIHSTTPPPYQPLGKQ